MSWIPGGTFLMGSNDFYPEEQPAHRVAVDGFWMDDHPVTNGEFRRFVSATGYITVAERVPDPADYPGIDPIMLSPGSLVFRRPAEAVWCSNNLMASFATQALLYRRMTGDQRFREYEQSAVDWLFGANPWGTSMMIGYPHNGTTARDPHSVHAARLGAEVLLGGLLDGPVYRSIYGNLKGIALHDADEYARFNTGFIVYHDDIGDYSTNEPIMDGTASMVYLLSMLSTGR